MAVVVSAVVVVTQVVVVVVVVLVVVATQLVVVVVVVVFVTVSPRCSVLCGCCGYPEFSHGPNILKPGSESRSIVFCFFLVPFEFEFYSGPLSLN